jgi:hypothetical protein
MDTRDATISLLCETLRPMLLTVCGVPLKDNELRLLGETFATVRIVKGYMAIAAMKTYITTCLAPYCHGLREKFQENLPVVLIPDNHTTHNHPDVLEMLSELNVNAIWLPPHSSHFLQPLDLSVLYPILDMSLNLSPDLVRRKKTSNKEITSIVPRNRNQVFATADDSRIRSYSSDNWFVRRKLLIPFFQNWITAFSRVMTNWSNHRL